ncbi:hypothetical protein D3C71_2213020 [compost metagenome]
MHIVPLDNQTHLFEKIIDATPNLIDKIQTMFQNGTPVGAEVVAAPAAKTVVRNEPVTSDSSTH